MKFLQSNKKMNNLIKNESKKLQKGDNGFNEEAHKKKLTAMYPELSNPRCYTHEMRPVPVENFMLLFTSNYFLVDKIQDNFIKLLIQDSNKEAALTYLKERYKTPPAQRYYFPAVSSWDYGWRPPPAAREDFHGRTFVSVSIIRILCILLLKLAI